MEYNITLKQKENIREMQQSQEEQFKVAPLIADDKAEELKQNIIMTLTGIHKNNLSCHRIQQFLLLFPVTLIIPLVIENKAVAILVPTIFNVLFNLIEDIIRIQNPKVSQILIRNIILGSFTFLWVSHLYFLKWYCNDEIYNIIFSGISIFTSLYTVARDPVKEFMANGLQNHEIGWNSTLYMRFFVALPTLLAEFIIFNSSQQTGILPSVYYLFPLRLFNSIIFLVWWFGWLSSLRSTLHFVLNKTGMLILGNESQNTFKDAFIGLLVNMVPIAIYQILYKVKNESTLSPMLIGATVTSIFTFIRYNISTKNISDSLIRSIVLIILQIIICLILVLIYKIADLSSINLTILLAIDLALYVIMTFTKEIFKGWSYLGCSFNVQCLKLKHIMMIQRAILRSISALCVLVILNNYSSHYLSILPYQSHILVTIAIPFLAYRTFKRCLSETISFSLHFSLLLCLICVNSGAEAEGTLLVLLMPPFPSSPWSAIMSIFKIPKKLQHKNECCYQILYFLGSLVGLFVYFLSFGTLQLTMIFGLPLYWPVIPTQTQGYQIKSAQNSLYQKILQNIDKSLFQFYDTGYYLLRIQKYILLLEIKLNCFGWCQVIDIRGLQVQQVTSCHSKEGETIDKLVEETWGDNKSSCSCGPLQVAITPYLKEKVNVPTENDIQLVGIIETKEFVNLFKEAALKAIIREFSRINLNEIQLKQAEIIMSQLSSIFKKQAAENLYPFDFSNRCKLSASYPVQSGKVKLPPLNQKGKKAEVINDFMDLLQNSHTDKFQSSNTALFQKEKSGLQDPKKDQPKEPKMDELNMACVLTFYYYSIGKQDYINTQKLFKLIKRQNQVVSQIDFEGFTKLISLALGAAFKISVDKYIEAQFDLNYQDFQQYDKTSFLGTSDSQEFKQAILQDKEHVWNLAYSKRTLAIKRLAHSQTNLFIFKVNQIIVKSVWNNLRFQLIYATNNNDQRYSIQTHPNLLRNLWVQACEEPFGYPSYHSGLMIVN